MIRTPLSTIALAFLMAGPVVAAPARVRPGEVLVAVADPGALTLQSGGRVSSGRGAVRAALERHGLDRYQAIGARPERRPGVRFMRLTSARPGFDPVAAARELSASGAFVAVAPNLVLDLYATTPNDQWLFLQWHVSSSGNADAQLPEAWDLGRGDTSTVIAVMDNGFDVTHEDLASQLWINRAETPGNGLDDDGNGYVDDVNGWDFGNHDNSPISEPAPTPEGLDVGFHGTFVAGVAAAATNNAIGIAGAGWNCRFMPLKVATADSGAITLEAVTEAFGYLVDHGAAVLNMSFGTPDTTARPYFQALVDAANAVDILCVAAAGNAGVSTKAWPAACEGVLAVGATTESNTRASFSNWGPWVDLAAPGELIWSSIANNYEYDIWTQIYLVLSGWDGESPYVYGDGTSFASPLVAGICALVRSKFPALPAAAVLNHVVLTGDVVAYDHPIGPRVNAFRALSQPAVGVDPTSAPAAAVELAYPNPFAAGTTIAFTLAAAGPVTLRLYDAGGRMVRELVRAQLPPGRHAILWDGRAADGRPALSGIYFASVETPGGRAVRKLVLAR